MLFKKNLFFQLLDTKLVFDETLHKHLYPNLTINDLKCHFNQLKANNDLSSSSSTASDSADSSFYLNSSKLNESKIWHNQELVNSLNELESLQNMIIDTLISSDELCRTIFIDKFNQFLVDLEKQFINLNNLNNRQTSNAFSTPLSVLLSVFHR